MRLVVRPAAAADIDDAFLWYERQRSGLGDEFLTALRAAVNVVSNDPERFPVINRDTRRILLGRFPYGVFYRIYGDVVVVVGCMHVRRNPRRWKART